MYRPKAGFLMTQVDSSGMRITSNAERVATRSVSTKERMKRLIVRLLKAGVSWLPWRSLPHGARRAIIEQLSEIMDHTDQVVMMACVAPRIGISTVKAKGEYGEIQSVPGDLEVFIRYARDGTWEKSSIDLVDKFFHKHDGGTFIDVGANIGLSTIPVARNPAVRCFAFEPEPVNFGNLAANISANCCHKNVTMSQMALFDRTCVIEFEIAEKNLGDHRIHLSNLPGEISEQRRRVIKVNAAPLDDVVGETRGALAVKIDAQGAEPFVIAGGQRILARAGLLMLEFWPYGVARLGGNLNIVIDFLEKEFGRISFVSAEEDFLPDPLPREDACARLRGMVLPAQDCIHQSWNVIAYRQTI
jgi:FkbM family methyltransferase